MLSIQALSTGSSGNCYLLRWQNHGKRHSALVDAGLPIRKLEVLLQENGLQLKDVDYIFITHEHSDHVENIKQLLKYTQSILFLTAGTWLALTKKHDIDIDDRLRFVVAGEQCMCDAMQVNVHKVPHDARETVCYSFAFENKKIAIVTDLGSITAGVLDVIKSVDILFLEFNHDEEMLKNSKYLPFLKRRISGPQGHLSNEQACRGLNQCPQKPTVLIGVHLSEKNNSTALVESMMITLGYEITHSFQNIELKLTANRYYGSVLPHGQPSEILSF